MVKRVSEYCDVHKWTAYQRWLGRYICEECGVIGYTDGKDYSYLGIRSTHGGKVIPYKCSHTEKKVVCQNLAISIIGDLPLCSDHKDTIKIPSAERKFHENVEKQNAKDRVMIEDAFRRMREATEEALGRKKSDNGD